MIQTRVIDHYGRNRDVVVQVHETEYPELEAKLAMSLLEKWGMVVGEPDGEDSAGRAKVRRMNPEDVVTIACDTAGLAVSEFRKRGWIHKGPTLEELKNEEEVKTQT